ncbi:MAG: hypothetical protein IJ849_05510 [Selenomonadaceae bacterium]|nr:hypothetical protein [Selenomonadaceae bacterium]
MSNHHYTPQELLPDEVSVLKQLYGTQTMDKGGFSRTKIDYLRELTEKELYSIEAGSTGLLGSVRQELYKIKGTLLPTHFNRTLRIMIEEQESLRLNYVHLGRRILAVVFVARPDIPDVIYRNMEDLEAEELDPALKKIMEADMRQGFDLRHGSLIRFAVYHTGREEYAVIVTGVQAVMDSFDCRELFCRTQGLPVKTNFKNLLTAEAKDELTIPIRNYWTQLLKDMPPLPHLPYRDDAGDSVNLNLGHRQETYLAYIPGHILSDLNAQSKSNRMMLMSILQTAWGVLLQEDNRSGDVTFCSVVPTGNVENGAQSLVPLRFQTQGIAKVQDMAGRVFQQFLVSKPFAALGRNGIKELLGKQLGDVEHLLNFYDFYVEEKSFASADGETRGTLVSQATWDARDMRLSLIFRRHENQVAVSFVYDTFYFSQETIQMLVRRYFLILQQMLTDWTLAQDKFRERLAKRWALDADTVKTDRSRRKIQDYVSRLALLQECDGGTIQHFVDDGVLITRFEGDRISEKDTAEQLVFVMEGKVARSIETGDGWYNALDILKENNWLNDNIFLTDKKSRLSAEVLTEQATLLLIPLQTVQDSIKISPLIARNIMRHLTRQMGKYQRLWIQS